MASMEPVYLECPLCGQTYQYGPQTYEGRPLSKYGITVCSSCFEGNHDGWAPRREKQILEILRERDLPVPERNKLGLLPRGD